MQTIFPPAPLCEPNPHGVFMDAAEHIIYQHKNTKASLRLARSTAGYHWGHNYLMPLNGGCGGPSIHSFHPTQYEAETAALGYLKSVFSRAYDSKNEADQAKKATAAVDKLLNTHRQTALAQVLAEIAALEAQLKKAA